MLYSLLLIIMNQLYPEFQKKKKKKEKEKKKERHEPKNVYGLCS